jgi:DNA-binding PadR family transcriptional regulator
LDKNQLRCGVQARGLEVQSAADREIRLGIWKIHILFHAAEREVWGTWLLEELAEHGHQLSPGTLYPALARMERNDWLERCGAAAHARARQAFRITPEGRRLLKTLRNEVTELYEEVVLGREPEHHEPRRLLQSNRRENVGSRRRGDPKATKTKTRRRRA